MQVTLSAWSLETMVTACGELVTLASPSAPVMAPALNTNTSAPSAVVSSRVWTVTVCAVWSVKLSVVPGSAPNGAVAEAVARKSPAAASPVVPSASAPMDHGRLTVVPEAIVPPPGVMVNDCDAPSFRSPLDGVARAMAKVSSSLAVICTVAAPAVADTCRLSAVALVPPGLLKVTVSVSKPSLTVSSVMDKVTVCAVFQVAGWKVRVRLDG